MEETLSTAFGGSKHCFQPFQICHLAMDVDEESIAMLKRRYNCPHFRILVIGRANAGKTTILEKVCGVAQGTKPIIYDEHGVLLKANISPTPEPTPEPNVKPRFKLSLKQLFKRKSASVPSETHLKCAPISSAAPITHLIPSIEVSCRVKCMVPLLMQPISEGHT